MEQNIMFSKELKKFQKMKEEMDRLWNKLIEESFGMKEEELWEWYEILPKFEGVGRTNSDPKYKNVK